MASTWARHRASSAGQDGAPRPRQDHIPALDGLRGFAACAVAVGHIRFHTGLGPVHDQIGSYAVLLFFILSGFLMGHLYLGRRFSGAEVEAYFAARVSRIVPLYYAVGLLAFLYGQVDGAFYYAMSPVDALRHVVMLDNVSVFWTIAPEFQFYFLFPLLWGLVHLSPRRRTPLAVAAAAIVLGLIALRYRLPGLLAISKLHIFLLGVAIAAAGPAVRARTGPALATLAQLGAVAILLCLIVPPGAAVTRWLYLDGVPDRLARFYYELPRVFMMGFCVFAFTLVETPVARLLFANPVARRLGRFSFSIYLLHTPVIYAAVVLGWTRTLPASAAIALILALSYVVGAASYRWFEEPSRILARAALLRLFASRRAWAGRRRRAPERAGLPSAG